MKKKKDLVIISFTYRKEPLIIVRKKVLVVGGMYHKRRPWLTMITKDALTISTIPVILLALAFCDKQLYSEAILSAILAICPLMLYSLTRYMYKIGYYSFGDTVQSHRDFDAFLRNELCLIGEIRPHVNRRPCEPYCKEEKRD